MLGHSEAITGTLTQNFRERSGFRSGFRRSFETIRLYDTDRITDSLTGRLRASAEATSIGPTKSTSSPFCRSGC